MKISVKIPLAMAIITGASMVSLVFGFASYFYVKSLMQDMTTQNSGVLTRETMAKLSNELYLHHRQVKSLSADSSLVSYLKDSDEDQKKEIDSNFKKQLALFPEWTEISLTDNAGNILIYSDKLNDGDNHLIIDSSGEIRKTLDLVLSSKQDQYTEPYHTEGSDEIMVTFMSPVLIDGEVRGVVSVYLEWERIMNILRNNFGSPLFLYNQKGFLIATNQREKESLIMNQDYSQEPFFHYVRLGKYNLRSFAELEESINGVDILTIIAAEQDSNKYNGKLWSLVGRFPIVSSFASSGDGILKTTALAVPFVIVVALLVLVIILRLVVSPISKLTKGVEAIARGDFSKRIELNTDDELNQLADRFNEMTAKLEYFYTSLDKKVKEKTKKLAEKTQETLQQNKELEQSKVAMLNILEDVEEEKTEIELLARDLEKFKLAVENASDHVVITDPEGIIIFANKAAQEITGFSFSEMKNQTPRLWGQQMELIFYEKFWKIIKTEKQSYTGEITNKRKSGEQYMAEVNVSPVFDSNKEVRFFVGIERDITKMKEMDRAKTEFVSMASHQLRTPLTSIKWYIEMLQAGDAGKISKGQKEYLLEVHDANERMIGLVNDLLHVSRIDMDTIKITPKPANIKEIVESVVKEMKPLVERKNVTVRQYFDGDVEHVSGDPELIRVIFQNLISNAIKYNFENGTATIKVAKNQKGITIEVSDTGYGIPKNAQDKIFTKLFRAENAKEKESEGSGLGMYIVKSIATQSNGTVSFVSEENKGTTFTVKLPLGPLDKQKTSKKLKI